MKIIDISRELFQTKVFEGDPVPVLTPHQKLGENGNLWELNALTLGLHNATHVDAPRHFVAGGGDAAELDIQKCMGECAVVAPNGDLTQETVFSCVPKGAKRVLLKGGYTLTASGAKALASSGVWLVGTERQTVGRADTVEVHQALLENGVVILESLTLKEVPVGDYTLFALPLKIAGAEASPVRAVLIKED